MGQGRQTWGVVATANEPSALTAAFVAHFKCLGAKEVHIYLDRGTPDFELGPLLKNTKGCKFTRATWANWKNVHGRLRPVQHVKRQLINAAHAYRRCNVDWLLHCDVDEFLMFDEDLSDVLTLLPAEAEAAHVKNLERAWLAGDPRETIFSGVFRVDKKAAVKDDLAPEGLLADATSHRFSGHRAGKSLLRTGLSHLPGIHVPNMRVSDDVLDRGAKVKMAKLPTARLLHFDGLTPLHWQAKLAKRVLRIRTRLHGNHNHARKTQFEQVRTHLGDTDYLHQFNTLLQVVDPELEAKLRSVKALRNEPFDPAASLRDVFPDTEFDLSPAAFDRVLALKEPEVITAVKEGPQALVAK